MKKIKIIAVAYTRGGKGHFLHQEWYKSINARIVRYIPRVILPFARKFSGFGAILSLGYSPFFPGADLYILDGIATITSVFFKRKSKIIAINSDTFFRNLEKLSPLKRIISLFLIKRIDGYLSTSQMMTDLAQKYTDKPNELVTPFVNAKKYESLKPNLRSTNVCTLGFGEAKGTDRLISAFKIYKKQFPDAKLYIVSGAGYSKKNTIKRNDIIFTEFTDPAPYLEKCGLYVNASTHESFGINILEAMCAGLPVLITENCGAKEIVDDKEMITSLDAKEIAKRMIWMHQNKNKYKLIEKYKKIARTFTKEKSIKSFKDALRKLMVTIK